MDVLASHLVQVAATSVVAQPSTQQSSASTPTASAATAGATTAVVSPGNVAARGKSLPTPSASYQNHVRRYTTTPLRSSSPSAPSSAVNYSALTGQRLYTTTKWSSLNPLRSALPNTPLSSAATPSQGGRYVSASSPRAPTTKAYISNPGGLAGSQTSAAASVRSSASPTPGLYYSPTPQATTGVTSFARPPNTASYYPFNSPNAAAAAAATAYYRFQMGATQASSPLVSTAQASGGHSAGYAKPSPQVQGRTGHPQQDKPS